MQMRDTNRRRPGPVLAALLLGAAAVVVAFYSKPMPAMEDKALLSSDSSVRVESNSAGLVFSPAVSEGRVAKSSGFVFYCAARVPPEAYAYLARACAAVGYTAVLSSMPLNFALLAPDMALKAASSCPGVARWVISGHSLGGAVAASFVARNAKESERKAIAVGGLLLLASCPDRGVDLSTKSLPVVTVGSTRDTLFPPAKIAEGRDRLPAGSRYVEIAGGNHAQFGEYGPESGDGFAEIPGPTQRKATVEEALALLDRAESGAGK
jgi:dienelactone hydrolase